MPFLNGLDATKQILASISSYKRSTQYELAQIKAKREGLEELKLDEIIVVALTANNTAAEKARCFEAGMTHFLSKPPNIEQLKATIKSVFSDEKKHRAQ